MLGRSISSMLNLNDLKKPLISLKKKRKEMSGKKFRNSDIFESPREKSLARQPYDSTISSEFKTF
jgi:hypothetical protein